MSASGAAATTAVTIDLGDRSYDILIGSGLLSDAGCLDGLPNATAAMVVTDSNVAPLHAQRVVELLGGRFRSVHTIALPAGEEHKNWQTLNLVFDAMLARGLDRKAMLFALGGGVVGDMTGFAAACYMRGIAFVQLPTTLLAQVDSSVGGKTAINHPLGKNMIGAFHQPVRVIADVDTLQTLPRRELVAGLAEVIKYGPIADMAFLDWLDGNLDALLAGDRPALCHAIRRSCEIKADVVGGDEREAGRRAILNFGHTFGHAIETGAGYGQWLHGEAVACGMVMAARLSQRLGMVGAEQVERLTQIILRAGLPTRGPAIAPGRYLELMRHDKKAEGGEIRFVLLDAPGHAVVCPAADTLVADVIAECSNSDATTALS